MISTRTDLAIETRELYQDQKKQEIPGVDVDVSETEDIKVTRVKILDENGEKEMNKPRGNYITIEAPRLKERIKELDEEVSKTLGNELIGLLNLKDDSNVFVAGLGNWNVTPDSLGPKVISRLLVTRHLHELMPDIVDERFRPLAALAPGVLGITGIETGEILKGVVERIHPDVIIAIDALASRKVERISTTIQIADTGINPGSGVGNNRKAVSEETLGIPVIAIGVPTVVDAVTIANDSIEMLMSTLKNRSNQQGEIYNAIDGMKDNQKQELINEVLTPYIGDLLVTPKEVDALIDDMSKIIANGINMASHKGMDLEDIDIYLN